MDKWFETILRLKCYALYIVSHCPFAIRERLILLDTRMNAYIFLSLFFPRYSMFFMLFDGLIQRKRIDIEFRFFECLFEVFIYQFICQLFLIFLGFLDFGKFCNFEPAQYRLIKLKLKISLARMLGNFFCICNIKQISSRIIFSNICARKLHSRLNGRKREWILLEVTLHLINNCISFLDRWQRKKK